MAKVQKQGRDDTSILITSSFTCSATALLLTCISTPVLLLHGLYATAAPQSRLPQLVLPNHVSSSCCSASITSTFASLSDCIRFSCCPQIASASPAATGLHPCTASAVLEGSSPCNCPLFSCKFWGSSKVQGHASPCVGNYYYALWLIIVSLLLCNHYETVHATCFPSAMFDLNKWKKGRDQ